METTLLQKGKTNFEVFYLFNGDVTEITFCGFGRLYVEKISIAACV